MNPHFFTAPFLVRRITNVIKWHQTYFGGPKLPVNQEGVECHEYV